MRPAHPPTMLEASIDQLITSLNWVYSRSTSWTCSFTSLPFEDGTGFIYCSAVLPRASVCRDHPVRTE